MAQSSRTCFATLCLMALPIFIYAQTPSAKDAPQVKSATSRKQSAPRSGEADPMAEQRRVTALSLLTSLADEAKGFQDQMLRARVLARAADALWENETDRARILFRLAWDAAESADAESARKLEEEMRRQQQTLGSAAVTSPPNLRNEVLRLAAKRDRALGEQFLNKLEEARTRDAENAASANRAASRTSEWMAPPAQAQRLRLAMQLLQDGDAEQALQFADTAITSVNRDAIDFLSALREKNASAADQRFVMLLQRAAADPASDANTVSGLSSYAFTPFLYVVFSPDGGASQSARRDPTPAPELPATVRAAFFHTAAQILLRPLPPPAQDTTTSGRTGKYLIIKRLLPLFEQHAPERVAELRVQMAALTPDVAERNRTGENRAVTRGIVPEDNSRDPAQDMQGRLDRAKDSAERDAIYADMAAALAGSGDARAREFADKIEETELRKQTRAYVDFQYLNNAIQKKDTQEAIRIMRSGELTHAKRVWGLTQTARLLMKQDRARAVELLEEAAAEARRIGGSEAERPRALAAVAVGFIEADRARAWELIAELVKAANSAEGFTGDDARVTNMLRFKDGAIIMNTSAADFNLLGIFRALAKDDLYRAIEVAKGFTGEAARANASLAIARTVLEEKQK